MSTQISGSQIVITGGNFQQNNQGSKGPFERLLEAASPAAFHDSDDVHDPPKCHQNTHALIMRLYGPAGSGKSAIGRSIAELCAMEGILVASYFFSRFDSTRNHGRSLIATIAYQVSLCFPDTRNRIAGAIGRDPLIFSRSLNSQISSLIIGPLQERIDAGYFNGPKSARIIIIDGLDECDDRDSQVKILDAISHALKQHHLPFIFLIASRPEPDIRTAFCFGYLSQISTRNPLDHGYRPSEDIRLFLLDKFAEIKESHPFRAQIPPVWPSEDALMMLVDKSSGQFIYASTVVKFVKSTRHRPPQRQETILGLRPAQHEMPFAELDALYMQIFLSVVNPEAALQILAFYLLSEFVFSTTASEMEKILSLEKGQIPVLLCDLTSLIFIREDPETSILGFFHASLADCLLDQSRSKQFWINEPLRHAEFAVLYLKGQSCQYKQEDLLMASIDIQDSDWCRYFRAHCRCAAPTMELQEAITKPLVVRQLFKQKVYDFIPEFFAMISQLVDPFLFVSFGAKQNQSLSRTLEALLNFTTLKFNTLITSPRKFSTACILILA
ncbi:hypothetical protein GALMADRAFT_141048 [Galerina marginata CBS 339.88]|uniref:Nephrocystin 3-like N-terminal domain-containing protein n=1 Tax=Galerina marginata (strain CBS 339.88) TaxID=685588 RepID=A0A067SUS4_GALM3|nr:hypothetical protein GALMADRAFT_141048 [Galerina marginata CBS 339.88]